jgi:RNA polymerase sigma factor (sigma-70 family)
MNQHLGRARDGDPSSKRIVIDALSTRIGRMALYYARRTGEDPDDLLQEAWVGLLEALSELDLDIGSPEQYLVCSARWRVLDAIKRARVRRSASLEDLDFLEELDCSYPDSALSAACAGAFVDHLNDSQRGVLSCLLSGLTWREAGEALGCSSANVAYYVRQLRRKYEEWSEEDVAPAL